MKNFMQKLQNSSFIKSELKISSFDKIHHVASDENEFKIINNLFINNDSNNSSNDNFVLITSFTHFVFFNHYFQCNCSSKQEVI